MSPYIPRGYVTTAQAVDCAFQSRHPDLAGTASARGTERDQLYAHYRAEFPGGYGIPARLTEAIRLRDAAAKRRAIMTDAVSWRDATGVARPHLEEPKQKLGTFGEEHLGRLRELDRIDADQHRLITDTAMELRSALAEGDLVSVLNFEEMPTVPKFRWRQDDGLAAVSEGRLSHRVEGTHGKPMPCVVLIKEADLMDWLGLILQVGDEARNHLDGKAIEVVAQTMAGKKATDQTWREWFRDRIANWPDDRSAPSHDEDFQAAQGYFAPGFDRDLDFRPARQNHTPPAWRRQGKRPPWGKAKNSAETQQWNSANLRTQN